MRHRSRHLLSTALLASVALAGCATTSTVESPETPSTQALLESSTVADWRTPDPQNLLYMDLDAGRVIIELAPAFAPEHAANIRALARAGFWNGTSIYRVQDNFVAQFGANVEDQAQWQQQLAQLGPDVRQHLPAEFERSARGLPFHRLPDPDGWAAQTGFADGFAAGRDSANGQAWMAHCYGVVGAGRDLAPDSSIGAELYVVTGQSPRQLDRNITVVGRVLRGMELLSALPRGPEPMGFHEDPALRTPIQRVVLAAELPASAREPIEVLRTDTELFDAIVESRRNRRDDFYKRPAGHIDLCNISVPVRSLTPD